MQHNQIAIRAEGVLAYKVHDGDVTTEVEDLSSIDLVINSDNPEHTVCAMCRAALTDPTGTHLWHDEDGHWLCRDAQDGGPHAPSTEPLSWINSAHIWPNPEEDSLTVAISIAGQRDAFEMTVRRTDGRIHLDVPHPSSIDLHLHETYPGTHRVGP